MIYEMSKLFIPYAILFISFGIIKISNILSLTWRKNNLTSLIEFLGAIILAYSFFEMWRGSALYIQNTFEHLNEIITEKGLLSKGIIIMFSPTFIFTIIGGVSLKISDLYEKNSKNNINSIAIRCCALSILGEVVSIATAVTISIQSIF